jgi:hypothetical protein
MNYELPKRTNGRGKAMAKKRAMPKVEPKKVVAVEKRTPSKRGTAKLAMQKKRREAIIGTIKKVFKK